MRHVLTTALLLLPATPLSGQRLVTTEEDALSGLRSRDFDTHFGALAYVERVGWRASDELRSATIEAAWAFHRGEVPTPESYHGEGKHLSAVVRTHDPAGIPLLIEHGLGTGGMVTNALADFGEIALPAVLEYVQPDRERPSDGDWPGSVSSGLRTLRFMVQDGTVGPDMRPRVAAVAEAYLTEGPHDYFLVRASMDLAIALGDARLVSLVERLTDPDAAAILIGPGTDPRRRDRTVEIAVDLLSGGDYWGPRRPCSRDCPPTAAAQRRPPPSASDVLQMFDSEADLNRAREQAGNLLRQVNSRRESVPRTEAEIQTLVEGLVEIALAPCADYRCRGATEASHALVSAAWRPGVYLDGLGYSLDIRGEPVAGAFDALVRIHETLAARALANGGDDPFMEAAWRDSEARAPDGRPTTFEHLQLFGSLRDVFDADSAPGGRGWEYALALFERSRPPCKEGDGPPSPPDCADGPGSAWCVAGDLLHQTVMQEARPWPGPNPDLWKRRCGGPGGPGGPYPWNTDSDWRR